MFPVNTGDYFENTLQQKLTCPKVTLEWYLDCDSLKRRDMDSALVFLTSWELERVGS